MRNMHGHTPRTFSVVILHWVEPQLQVVRMASQYFQLFAASTPFTVTSAVTAATFRSLRDPRTPMVITMATVVINTVLGYFLVLGITPFPKLQIFGAGVAVLLTQAFRCAALLTALYRLRKGPTWRWPWQCAGYARIFRFLFKVTYPLVLSEFLWGLSAFAYTVVFARLGTAVLASSQIVMTVENLFIVAASGLPSAAVALIGQAIGQDSILRAKQEARSVLCLGFFGGLLFTALLTGASFLLPVIYPVSVPFPLTRLVPQIGKITRRAVDELNFARRGSAVYASLSENKSYIQRNSSPHRFGRFYKNP